MRKHFIEDMFMRPTSVNLILYGKHIAGRLSGHSGAFLDDLVEAGYEEFSKFTKQAGQRFDADAKDNVTITSYSSYKRRPFIRSALASECHSLTYAFYCSYFLK